MTQENAALLHRAFDAVNRRDLDAFLSLMDEEVDVVSRIVAVEGGLHGHGGVRRWWDSWFDVFPDYDTEIVEIRDFGDVLIAAMRAIGHGVGSDVPLQETLWHASRWRRGKCVWWRVCKTLDEAVEAAGLSESEARSNRRT
jgi:hypothetical protein